MKNRLPFGLAATAALTLIATAPAGAATYSVGVTAASGTINRPGPTGDDSGSGPTGQARSVSSFQDETISGPGSGYGWGSSNASASAGAGAIHLRAESSASVISGDGGAINAQGSSSAWGGISESFAVLAPGCAAAGACGVGAHGTMTFAIVVNGSLGGGGSYATSGSGGGWSGMASWDSGGGVNAGSVPDHVLPTYVEWLRGESYSENQTGVTSHAVTGSGKGSQTYTIDIIFGQPITFSMVGHVYSNAGATYDASANPGSSSASSSFLANLSHTMGWGGISELRDANGDLVTGFTAMSTDGSGVDFRLAAVSAVPEPSAASALVAGLMLLIGLSKARRLPRPR